MGNLRAVVTVAAIVFAAGCGDDGATIDAPIVIIDAAIDAPPDAYVPDAPNYDFTCLNNAAPTTATATIQLSGTAQQVVVQGTMPSVELAANVTIQACRVNAGGTCTGQNNLGTVGPTGVDGVFMTAAISTGTPPVPLDGYLVATKATYRTTRVYPASPLTMNQPGVPVLLLGTATIAMAAQFNLITHTAGNAIIATVVTDCSMPPQPIPGATVAVTQNGQPVGNTQDASLLDPMGAGTFITFDVPPGDTTVAASYNGMTFRTHVVGTAADGTSATQIRPGF